MPAMNSGMAVLEWFCFGVVVGFGWAIGAWLWATLVAKVSGP